MLLHRTKGRRTDTPVDDVMTRSVISLRSTDGLRAAVETLILNGIGGAPVQLGGVVLGTVTLMDLNRALSAGSRKRSLKARATRSMATGTVVDVMSPDVHALSSGTSLAEVIDHMVSKGVDRVLVVDAGQVIGIVTSWDVARTLALGVGVPSSPDHLTYVGNGARSDWKWQSGRTEQLEGAGRRGRRNTIGRPAL